MTTQSKKSFEPNKIDFTGSFRNPKLLHLYIDRIRERSRELRAPLRLMEVCGGHTHTVLKYGLSRALAPAVQFLHGPGCPVCVIGRHRIDQAVQIARRENTTLVTLGDLMRVPGKDGSLSKWRAEGCDICPVYSPASALEIARENPTRRVVFFAVGFETTTPPTAWLVENTIEKKINNLFFHINHVLLPPAIEALLDDPDHNIGGFLGPSHVSVVAGAQIYRPIAKKYRRPVVVAGFEPSDILEATEMILEQTLAGAHEVQNQYKRASDFTGNRKAQRLVERYFTARSSFEWRGLGAIANSALCLKDEFSHLDAELLFDDLCKPEETSDEPGCLCPEILKGKKEPPQCPHFSGKCTPSHPLGACMVSTEGACAAWSQYGDAGV